jgi:hypothetical protein
MDGGKRAIIIDEVPPECASSPASSWISVTCRTATSSPRPRSTRSWSGSGTSSSQADYVDSGCGMGREATLHLLRQGIRLVSTDGWSWDAPFSHTAKRLKETGDASLIWKGHKAGRDIGNCQLEKLHNLEALPSKGFTVSCFPDDDPRRLRRLDPRGRDSAGLTVPSGMVLNGRGEAQLLRQAGPVNASAEREDDALQRFAVVEGWRPPFGRAGRSGCKGAISTQSVSGTSGYHPPRLTASCRLGRFCYVLVAPAVGHGRGRSEHERGTEHDHHVPPLDWPCGHSDWQSSLALGRTLAANHNPLLNAGRRVGAIRREASGGSAFIRIEKLIAARAHLIRLLEACRHWNGGAWAFDQDRLLAVRAMDIGRCGTGAEGQAAQHQCTW